MKQGIIVEYNKAGKFYIVRVDSQTTVNLPIEECGVTKFRSGDVIDFELATTKTYGSYVKDPIINHNVHLSYLESIAGTDVTIEGNIIAVKHNQYLVSYYGFICYMTVRKEVFDKLPPTELASFVTELKNFKVKEVRNGNVQLSTHHKIKEQLQLLKQREFESLTVGFCFEGIVVETCGFGVLVRYNYTEGLVHVSNIIEDYHLLKVNHSERATLIQSLIPKGDKVKVIVEQIYDSRYSLKILRA